MSESQSPQSAEQAPQDQPLSPESPKPESPEVQPPIVEPVSEGASSTPPEAPKAEPVQVDRQVPASAATPVIPPRPVQSRDTTVPLPTPADDADLDEEIEAALGGMSLTEMYEADGTEATAADKARTESGSSGIKIGRVISVTDEGLFLDVGGKSEGFLPREELEEGESLEVGDEAKVAVVRYDGRDGLLILSKRTAAQQLLRENLREGSRVEARVLSANKGGLEMDIKGLRAFMPMSQIDIGRIEEPESLVGERFVCEVTEVERGDKNVVLSRRKVQESERAEMREETMAELEVGQLRHGTVRSIMDFGAFVDLGGVDGLIHISQMSWTRVKHPSEILSVGQPIDVVVIGIDPEKDRIALSLRQAGGDPWTTVEQNYLPGTKHQAQVKNLADFGAFAELEPGIEGLIPISQMTWAGRIRHPSEVVQPGMMVEVEIMSVDVEKHRIGLSMKQVQSNPWADITEKYQVDQSYTGTVARLTDFGAFVTLEPGVDGLVHISELSDGHVNRVGDVVSQGQEVTVKVINVDTSKQRIGLTMKTSGQAEASAEAVAEYSSSANVAPTEKKSNKKRPRRGGLDM